MLSEAHTRILAIAVLTACGAVLAGAVVTIYRRSHYTPAQFPLYMLNFVLGRVRWRARIIGSIGLPPGKGAVIVSNHVGPIDPGLIALACRRPVHWMVASEYCSHPAVGWALRILGAIPVGRAGIDTKATKLAIRHAQSGELVGMFPEGRINNTGQFMLPGRPGAALVALKACVPVIPCYITGSPYRGSAFSFLILPARARVVVGRPLDISSLCDVQNERDVLESLTRTFMIEIARLAGVQDFEPQLAGKRWMGDE